MSHKASVGELLRLQEIFKIVDKLFDYSYDVYESGLDSRNIFYENKNCWRNILNLVPIDVYNYLCNYDDKVERVGDCFVNEATFELSEKDLEFIFCGSNLRF